MTTTPQNGDAVKAKTEQTYEPHLGPITLDTLDDLFASRRTEFGGFTMKADDDADEDDTEGDPGDEDGADDTDDDEGDEYEPPTKEEWERTQAALKKANGEAKKRRLRARESAAKPGKHKAEGDADDDGDDDKSAETEAKWKGRVVKQAAKAALASAGADKPERLLALVDVDDLEVDDDGEVDGLDDEIDRLREEYPELFKRTRGGRVETGDRTTGKGNRKPLTATERQAAAILGKN